MKIESYKKRVPLPEFRENVLKSGAINGDIITGIHSLVEDATKDVRELAPLFKHSSTKKTAFAIWYFLRTRAVYVKDDENKQQIRLPRRFIWDTAKNKNSGDCKSFALFTVSILRALGLPAYFRYASYSPGRKNPSHVYAFTKDKRGREIIIDGCYPYFDKQKKYTFVKNYDMTVTSLSGTSSRSTNAEKARKFLDSISKTEKARVIQALRKRRKFTRPQYGGRIGDVEDYPILGMNVISDNVIDGVIAGKKKPKLTKEQKAARKKKRQAKAKKGAKKFLWGIAFVNLLPIRAAFNSIVAMNINALANNIKFLYDNRKGKTAAEWKKIAKVWKNVGGIEKALLKAVQLGTKHKPLFLSKKAKGRYEKRKKGMSDYIGAICIDELPGIGNPAIIAAAVAAASGIIAAMIPAIMQGLKKGGKSQDAAQVQEQGQEMVREYKAAGSPAPAPSSDGGLDQESEDVGAVDQAGLTSLFDTLGKVAQVGIQAAGNAVAKKAKKNKKLNAALNATGNGVEDAMTGRYLRESGYTGAAKSFASKASSLSGMLLPLGLGVLAIFGFLAFKKK